MRALKFLIRALLDLNGGGFHTRTERPICGQKLQRKAVALEPVSQGLPAEQRRQDDDAKLEPGTIDIRC